MIYPMYRIYPDRLQATSVQRADGCGARAGFLEAREEMAKLRAEIIELRRAHHNDIRSLKVHMYWAFLVQTTVIVGLIVWLSPQP